MIGQKNLINTLDIMLSEDRYPQFSILTGPVGSGKKLLAKYISKNLDSKLYILPDVKIDTIRHMISYANKTVDTTVFLIPDGDEMLIPSKNALLKIVEEPPKNCYFIMTLEDINNMISTVRSRAQVFQMEPYTKNDILDYVEDHSNILSTDFDIVTELCETPGQVDMIESYGVREFYDYVEKVVDNIDVTSGPNSFKIASKLALKKDSDGYDVRLFLRAFMAICCSRMYDIGNDDILKYARGVSVTSTFLRELNIRSISKPMLVDDWILAIREEWL